MCFATCGKIDAVVRSMVLIAAALVPLVIACRSSVFVCSTDEQCGSNEQMGVCQPVGYCSFVDGSCASGQRYGEHAGGGLAGTCVHEEDASGSTSTGNPSATSDSDPAGSTSSSETSSQSTGPHVPGETTSFGDTDEEPTSTSDGMVTDTGGEDSTGAALPCAFEESFSGGGAENVWYMGGAIDVVLENDMLVMHPVSESGSNFGWASSQVMDFTGRSLVLEIGVPPPANSTAQMLLQISTPVEKYEVVIQGSELVARIANGNDYDIRATTSFDLAKARFVRLSDLGDAIRWSYSDGRAWTTLVDVSVDDLDVSAAQIGLVGGTWQYEPTVNAIGFDTVTVCP